MENHSEGNVPVERQVRHLHTELMDFAFERCGGHAGDPNYDPYGLCLLARAVDAIENLGKIRDNPNCRFEVEAQLGDMFSILDEDA